MTRSLTSVLFGWYPYLCLTVFLLGSLLRYDREQYSWKSYSSQLLRRGQLRLGSNLFHVGILVIFLGHAGGLLTPLWLFEGLGISHGFKQGLAIVVGGAAGIACFVGIALLAHRRLFDARVRANSSFGDTAILLLLWAQLCLGLLTIPVSLQHMDGGEMVKFMGWAQGILTLDPGAAGLLADSSAGGRRMWTGCSVVPVAAVLLVPSWNAGIPPMLRSCRPPDVGVLEALVVDALDGDPGHEGVDHVGLEVGVVLGQQGEN